MHKFIRKSLYKALPGEIRALVKNGGGSIGGKTKIVLTPMTRLRLFLLLQIVQFHVWLKETLIKKPSDIAQTHLIGVSLTASTSFWQSSAWLACCFLSQFRGPSRLPPFRLRSGSVSSVFRRTSLRAAAVCSPGRYAVRWCR